MRAQRTVVERQILQSIHSVSGKTGDGFGQNQGDPDRRFDTITL